MSQPVIVTIMSREPLPRSFIVAPMPVGYYSMFLPNSLK